MVTDLYRDARADAEHRPNEIFTNLSSIPDGEKPAQAEVLLGQGRVCSRAVGNAMVDCIDSNKITCKSPLQV